jgi:hypothetical protein
VNKSGCSLLPVQPNFADAQSLKRVENAKSGRGAGLSVTYLQGVIEWRCVKG